VTGSDQRRWWRPRGRQAGDGDRLNRWRSRQCKRKLGQQQAWISAPATKRLGAQKTVKSQTISATCCVIFKYAGKHRRREDDPDRTQQGRRIGGRLPDGLADGLAKQPPGRMQSTVYSREPLHPQHRDQQADQDHATPQHCPRGADRRIMPVGYR